MVTSIAPTDSHVSQKSALHAVDALLTNDFDKWLLSQRYAVARSQYAKQGWAVAEALVDNERLRQHALTLLTVRGR